MQKDNILAEFSHLLRKLVSSAEHITEAMLRFTFCVALLNSTKIEIHEILLEYPQKKLNGKKGKRNKKIDLYIPSINGKRMAIEFKYHRNPPNGSTMAHALNAGELFADIYHLYKFPQSAGLDRLLVYCTDPKMCQYFRNPRNCFSGFFDMPQGRTMTISDDFIKSKCKTFRKKIDGCMTVTIKCLWSECLPNAHYLRIYRVVPL